MLDKHIISYAGLTLLYDLKEEQVPQISNRTNKKRKKDNASELSSTKKKTKANQDNLETVSNNLDQDYHREKKTQKYFLTIKNIYNWYNSLNKVKKYIDNNKKRPSYRNKDKEIQKLGRWTSLQLANYKKKKEAMKDANIYSNWTQFMNEYQEYFLNTCDKWYNSLNKVKEYINKNKKKPKESDKDKEIQKLRRWISIQQTNYKNKKETMKDKNIYCKWTEFMNEYQEYFLNICDICGKKDHKTNNCNKFFFH